MWVRLPPPVPSTAHLRVEVWRLAPFQMSDMRCETITLSDGRLKVPDHPVVPFIEGDGTGPDIGPASVRVFDAAVKKAYGGKRAIVWKTVLAGQREFDTTGNWLLDETVKAFRTQLVGIKGPLTTPMRGPLHPAKEGGATRSRV